MSVFTPPLAAVDEARHRWDLALGVRNLAILAFQPAADTASPSGDTTINTTSYVSLTGLAKTISVIAPSIVLVVAQINVEVTAYGELNVQILNGSTQIGFGTWAPQPALLLEGGQTAKETIHVHAAKIQLAPNTSATIDVKAKALNSGNFTVKSTSVMAWTTYPDKDAWRKTA